MKILIPLNPLLLFVQNIKSPELQYLQVRHTIVSLFVKGQFRLYPTELEQFITSSTSVKGKISHLYRILSESSQNSFSPLRTIWEL